MTQAGSRIPASTAQLLIGAYRDEEGWTPGKTRAIWFSSSDIDDIAALIAESNGDGVRIYFGKYPGDSSSPVIPDPANAGRVTTVFIPTLATADGSHQDLFPPVPETAQTLADGLQAFNHGELCPPNCPPTTPTA
jgi:hypothetical protein